MTNFELWLLREYSFKLANVGPGTPKIPFRGPRTTKRSNFLGKEIRVEEIKPKKIKYFPTQKSEVYFLISSFDRSLLLYYIQVFSSFNTIFSLPIFSSIGHPYTSIRKQMCFLRPDLNSNGINRSSLVTMFGESLLVLVWLNLTFPSNTWTMV